jgi:hypothetical protein
MAVFMFVCPCIVSIFRNLWPTRCKIWFIYLYPISSTCFGRSFRPSSGAHDCIYRFWCSPPTLLPAGVMDEMEYLVHHTGRQQHRRTISEAVNTVKCFWWWAKTSPETCRAYWVQINKPKSCILLIINYELLQCQVHFPSLPQEHTYFQNRHSNILNFQTFKFTCPSTKLRIYVLIKQCWV